MIKITNGVKTIEVTHGAYENVFKKQGYREEVTKAERAKEAPQKPAKTADEKFIDSILEKPIATWDKEEIKKYAAIKGIDLTGTKSVNEARERVKKTL